MVKSFIEAKIGSVQRVTSAESEDRATHYCAVYLYLKLQSKVRPWVTRHTTSRDRLAVRTFGTVGLQTSRDLVNT
jgi:hypothetical protein